MWQTIINLLSPLNSLFFGDVQICQVYMNDCIINYAPIALEQKGESKNWQRYSGVRVSGRGWLAVSLPFSGT